MFAIQCPYPYCNHENQPGARFCAACGAPLHLKPCAQCGRVEDVTAKVCAACNTAFPPIRLAEFVPDAPATSPAHETPPAPASAPASAAPAEVNFGVSPPQAPLRATPLIVIALVAGGLPILWMFRTQLPMPSFWQGPKTSSTAAPAMQPPVTAPPAVAVDSKPASLTPPAPAAEHEKAIPAPTRVDSSTPPPEKDKNKPAKAEKPAREKKPQKEPAAQENAAPPRPCTEAVAALGLCTLKEAKK